MAREHDEVSRRPDRVIIVDADDPMHEIHGDFVWRDEHDRVVTETRRQAFAEGYDAAMSHVVSTAASSPRGRQRRLVSRLHLAGVLLLILFFVLMLPVVLA